MIRRLLRDPWFLVSILCCVGIAALAPNIEPGSWLLFPALGLWVLLIVCALNVGKQPMNVDDANR